MQESKPEITKSVSFITMARITKGIQFYKYQLTLHAHYAGYAYYSGTYVCLVNLLIPHISESVFFFHTVKTQIR